MLILDLTATPLIDMDEREKIQTISNVRTLDQNFEFYVTKLKSFQTLRV